MGEKANKSRQIFFLCIIYLTFIALGLPDTGFGVAWNEMRLDFNVPLEAAGLITMLITTFSALSGFCSGYLLNKFGTGIITAISCLATGIAILGFTFSPSYAFLMIMALPLGFGAGAVDSGLNAYVAENLSSKHMNWLHGSWGIGATLSPLIVTFGITNLNSWRYGYGIIAVSVLILSVIILVSLPMWKSKHETLDETVVETTSEIPVITGLAPKLSLLSYVIYVGIEGGLGLWLSALLIESRGLPIGLSGTIVGIYFGCITIGRFLMGFMAEVFTNRQLVSLGIGISFIGSLLFLVPNNPLIYGLGILLIGLGFAPIYPCLMHETSSRYNSEQAKKIISQQVAISYISLLIFVPILGWVATHTFLEIIAIITVACVASLHFVVAKLNQLT